MQQGLVDASETHVWIVTMQQGQSSYSLSNLPFSFSTGVWIVISRSIVLTHGDAPSTPRSYTKMADQKPKYFCIQVTFVELLFFLSPTFAQASSYYF